jgi:Methyltransferase FkbM domain
VECGVAGITSHLESEAAARRKTESVVERVLKMPLININRLIAENLASAPDLLSIDVEGLDTAILKTLDLSRFRPAVICVEALLCSPTATIRTLRSTCWRRTTFSEAGP